VANTKTATLGNLHLNVSDTKKHNASIILVTSVKEKTKYGSGDMKWES
jgi:hypothetical protein